MNPNTRKRHLSTPKCEQCPDTRNPGEPRTRADRKADKNRLFNPKNAIKESDNMKRIDHDEFKTYTSPAHDRIRVPRSRLYAPRQCMADGFTVTITRKRAAEALRDMRKADNNAPHRRNKENAANSLDIRRRKSDNESTLGHSDHVVRLYARTCDRLGIAKKQESGLDKAHAALVRKAQRNLGLPYKGEEDTKSADNTGSRQPCNAVRKAMGRTRKGMKTQRGSHATRLWESYMSTSRKITWEEYMTRWLSDNTA